MATVELINRRESELTMGFLGLDGVDFSWFERGNCSGADSGLFFDQGEPTRGRAADNPSTERRQQAVANLYCNGKGYLVCPVRDRCLQFALDTKSNYGVYGGLTENQRTQYRNFLRVRAWITVMWFHP